MMHSSRTNLISEHQLGGKVVDLVQRRPGFEPYYQKGLVVQITDDRQYRGTAIWCSSVFTDLVFGYFVLKFY